MTNISMDSSNNKQNYQKRLDKLHKLHENLAELQQLSQTVQTKYESTKKLRATYASLLKDKDRRRSSYTEQEYFQYTQQVHQLRSRIKSKTKQLIASIESGMSALKYMECLTDANTDPSAGEQIAGMMDSYSQKLEKRLGELKQQLQYY
jgi:hypothetical protein